MYKFLRSLVSFLLSVQLCTATALSSATPTAAASFYFQQV